MYSIDCISFSYRISDLAHGEISALKISAPALGYLSPPVLLIQRHFQIKEDTTELTAFYQISHHPISPTFEPRSYSCPHCAIVAASVFASKLHVSEEAGQELRNHLDEA